MHLAIAAVPDEGTGADLRLAALAAAGDARARRLLVSRLAGRVGRICVAIMGHGSDAQDATQIALLEILRAARSYSGSGRLESWSDRIAARVATRYASKERRHAQVVTSAAAAEAPPAPEPALAERLARPLSEYLAALPANCREVLVLRHALDYSVAEVAEILAIPPGTVKDRLVRGRKRIRKMIARDRVIGANKGSQR